MLGTRHEEYSRYTNGIPFVLNLDIERSTHNHSSQNNWHENLEIQFCKAGSGTVLLNGEKYQFSKNDIAVANSNVIHYTDTDTSLIYDCIIISTDFCNQIGIDITSTFIQPIIKNPEITNLFCDLCAIYQDVSIPYRTAKLNKVVLALLISLAEKHSIKVTSYKPNSPKYETVKNAIDYIRNNYQHKLSLDQISKQVLCDKYTLCKDFKRFTGQTVIENLNHFRCIKAIDYLTAGYSVAETALMCGFENLSFFTKTFKTHIGKLPSEYKNRKISE